MVFVISIDGFQVFDSKSKKLIKNFLESDGIPTMKIRDIQFDGNKMYLLHREGVQQFDLSFLNLKKSAKVERVEVTSNKEVIHNPSALNLDYDQNKLVFEIIAPSIILSKDLKYRYRLFGLEEEWFDSDYSDNQIVFKSLPPGEYQFEWQLVYDRDVLDTGTIMVSIDLPFWKKWWFMIVWTILIVGFTTLVYKRLLAIQKKKAQQQFELNASKLTAIQSQMNPHFIFNALNSIQALVLKGNIKGSYTYISKFAELVRKTLNNSDKDFIDIESEIELIELYLLLEKLRFDDNFTYVIEKNNAQDVLVPPMIIQPFIENALIHGLLHKEGEKHITIRFELKESLKCYIIDNGVGMAKAKEINERKGRKHESFAVKAINRRLKILEDQFEGDFGVVYDSNESGGTTVIITMPIQHKF